METAVKQRQSGYKTAEKRPQVSCKAAASQCLVLSSGEDEAYFLVGDVGRAELLYRLGVGVAAEEAQGSED